jgi:hypothetical protein
MATISQKFNLDEAVDNKILEELEVLELLFVFPSMDTPGSKTERLSKEKGLRSEMELQRRASLERDKNEKRKKKV